MTVWGDDARGATVALHSGQRLIVCLPVRGAPGDHSWKLLAGLGEQLGMAQSTFEPNTSSQSADASVLCGGGSWVYTVIALHPGVASLRFGLTSSALQGATERTIDLRVAIRKAAA